MNELEDGIYNPKPDGITRPKPTLAPEVPPGSYRRYIEQQKRIIEASNRLVVFLNVKMKDRV